ncbi:MAG: metallophosphoesterase family protein [Pirellulales bacterium]
MNQSIRRREFLGTTLGGIASAVALGTSGWVAKAAESDASATVGGAAFDPDTLFLTWQRDPTTTMTVQWVAPEIAADTTVYCGPLTEALSLRAKTINKPFPDTEMKVHRAELTGLEPGTEYQFQIGTNSQIYRFRTMPAKATNTIQFVSGGDCGTGEHAIANNILAAKQEPYFALIGGDLAYDDGRKPGTFNKFLRNYRAHMVDPSGRLIPMITCIGNHDVDGGFVRESGGMRSKSPHYLSVFDGLFHEKTFGVLDIGDYLSLVLLDTDHLAPVAGEQTDWLARTLADRQDRPHLIAVNHIACYPSVRPMFVDEGRTRGEEQRLHWCPLYEKYKVDVVLEHHDHAFKRTHPLTDGLKDKNGVLYLGDGSWGKLRAPNSPEERPYLAVTSEAFHISVQRLEGRHRYHVALDDTGRVMDVAMTKNKRPSRRG